MTDALLADIFDVDELLAEIERAFGLRLSEEEFSSVQTMGDMHDLLMDRIDPMGGEACLSTMAFLRLRRAMAPLAPGITLRPNTPLSEIPVQTPRALFGTLRLENGLRLPEPEGGLLTGLSGLLVFSLIVFVLTGFLGLRISWPIATGVVVAVIGLISLLQRVDPLRFPHECRTVGDLARAVAAYNAAALAREGAKLDSGTVWQALVQIVAPIALTPKSEIDRDTTFFRAASA